MRLKASSIVLKGKPEENSMGKAKGIVGRLHKAEPKMAKNRI